MPKQDFKRAKLFVCASCEWIFMLSSNCDGCPKCNFGYYTAHYTYGVKAYSYFKTQYPWKQKILAAKCSELHKEIKTTSDYYQKKVKKSSNILLFNNYD